MTILLQYALSLRRTFNTKTALMDGKENSFTTPSSLPTLLLPLGVAFLSRESHSVL